MNKAAQVILSLLVGSWLLPIAAVLHHNTINDGSAPTYQRSVMFDSYNYGGLRNLSEYEVVFVQWQYWGGG